ncbi:MAG: S24 family peptidase [Candidatus Dojkabacteria bacterium]|nr:MAG: S24 family peptidase [Candidatus Dojkabacteria bacterium]
MHQIQKDLLALSRNINLGERSLREIGSLIGVDHPQKVQHHLEQLEKKGFITIDRSAKTIKNNNYDPSKENRFINVPIVGSASCGPAQLIAEENIDGFLKISKSTLKQEKVIAVVASGNSMNKAKIEGNSIEDGDYVIVDYLDREPLHGSYILSVVDGAANIKRLYVDKDNQQVVLLSESSQNYPPIYIHEKDYSDFMINGKVVQVIKKPKF